MAAPAAAAPALPAPPARMKLCARLGLAAFCIYLVALYVLALDQQFHWGLFPAKLEKVLTAEVKQLGDASLPAAKHQALVDDIVSNNTFSVPVLLKAIESGLPAGRDAAVQCLQQISQKFYNMDLTPLGADPAKLNAWWAQQQADWAKAESAQK